MSEARSESSGAVARISSPLDSTKWTLASLACIGLILFGLWIWPRNTSPALARQYSDRLMAYVETNLKTPCPLAVFAQDPQFLAILCGPGLSTMVFGNVPSLKWGLEDSAFVLQPSYMVNENKSGRLGDACCDAVYFTVHPRVDLTQLQDAIKARDGSPYVVRSIVISSGGSGDEQRKRDRSNASLSGVPTS